MYRVYRFIAPGQGKLIGLVDGDGDIYAAGVPLVSFSYRPKMSEHGTRGKVGWSCFSSPFLPVSPACTSSFSTGQLVADSSFRCEFSATSPLRRVGSNSCFRCSVKELIHGYLALNVSFAHFRPTCEHEIGRNGCSYTGGPLSFEVTSHPTSFPFDESIPHAPHTCITFVSSGITLSSQSISASSNVRRGGRIRCPSARTSLLIFRSSTHREHEVWSRKATTTRNVLYHLAPDPGETGTNGCQTGFIFRHITNLRTKDI
jgi:hypothetical protein